MGLPVMCEALFWRKLKIFAQARRKCGNPPSPLLPGRLVCHVGPSKKNRRPGTARQRVQDRGPGIAARRQQWGLRATLPRQPPDRGVAKHSSDRASALPQLRRKGPVSAPCSGRQVGLGCWEATCKPSSTTMLSGASNIKNKQECSDDCLALMRNSHPIVAGTPEIPNRAWLFWGGGCFRRGPILAGPPSWWPFEDHMVAVLEPGRGVGGAYHWRLVGRSLASGPGRGERGLKITTGLRGLLAHNLPLSCIGLLCNWSFVKKPKNFNSGSLPLWPGGGPELQTLTF